MDIKAHITGTIWKIEMEVGDEVEEDEDKHGEVADVER